MNITSLKPLSVKLGALAALAATALCGTMLFSSGMALAASNAGNIPAAPINPDATLKIAGNTGSIHVTPGSVATGNHGSVIVTVNGTPIPTQEDASHVITVVHPDAITNNDIEVLLLVPVNLDLSKANGNLHIEGVHGQMVLSVGGGEITTRGVTLSGHSRFYVNGGGNISFNGSLDANSTTNLNIAQGGQISVELPSNAAFYLHARAKSGNVSTNFSVLNGTTTPNDIRGYVGNAPTAALFASVHSGGIKVYYS